MVLGEMAQHGLCALRGSSWAPHLHLQPHPSRKQSLHSANKWYRATHLKTIINKSPPGGLLSIGTSLLPVFLPSGHPASYCPSESMCFCFFSLVYSPSCPPSLLRVRLTDMLRSPSSLHERSSQPLPLFYILIIYCSLPRGKVLHESRASDFFIPESSPLAEW